MKHLLAFISPRLALLASLCVCIILAALLALTSPLQIVISIRPLGSAVSAAPAAILPTVTPPPPPTEAPPTATEAPPAPTAISTAEPTATEAPPAPTAISTAEPTATEAPPAPTAISTAEPTATEVPHTPTELPPAPTEVPPTATLAPPAPTELPPAPTEVPPTATAAPPAPTELPPTATAAPVASSQRRIERAPDNLPNTADPEQAARFVTSYLPLMGLALALLLMGWLVRSGAFRQRVLVDLSPSLLTPQRICLGELQLDPYQVRARWLAGSSVATLVEDLALHNQGVSRIALTLAVQEALHS